MNHRCIDCEKCCEVLGIDDGYHGYYCDFSDTTFIELYKSRPFQFNNCKRFKKKGLLRDSKGRFVKRS